MDIQGSVALVTGANRGLGRAYAEALLEQGAKVYAGVRDPASVTDSRLVPVPLNVTDRAQASAAAERLTDVDLVINNAGVSQPALPLDVSLEDARHELEVNYLGSLSVAQAFAPVLAANGGGALVNVLSVASWIALPRLTTYAASKSAAWAMTNALRQQLLPNGTLVVGVHAGYLDTDLAAVVPAEQKSPPALVVNATLRAIEAGEVEVLADDWTRSVKANLHDDHRLIYPTLHEHFGAA